MIKYISVLLLFFISFSVSAENVDFGLFVKSFPSNDSEKTSLVLENNQSLKIDKETSMSFDINVRKDNVFGIVFRIITDKHDNIDLIFTVGEDNKRYPMLVINEAVYMITEEIKCDQWTHINVSLSPDKNEIALEYKANKTNRIAIPFDVSAIDNVKISFGLCPFEGYTLYDIASVSLRNIKILKANKLIRFWKLEKHDGETSVDSIAKIPAIVTNPLWLTDAYASWSKIYTKQVAENSLFTFDPQTGIFYTISPNSSEIQTFNADTRESNTIKVHSGTMAANAPNQLLFLESKKSLLSYNLDENIISIFSLKNQTWDNNTKPVLEHGYWNNSVSYSAVDSSIVSFGGYGFYKYNNDLVRIFSNHQPIKKSNLPEISPRHSASTLIDGTTLYIFGGRGNKSGRQELSPKNYYDFYSVNLLTEQTNKLWELDPDSMHLDFIPSENMILDGNYFYVFTTKEGGTLLRFDKDHARFDQISHPVVGEDFTCHYLYMNLYFSPTLKKFYVLINKMYTDKPSVVSIYSLNYPPIIIARITANQASTENQTSKSIYTILAFVALVFIISIIVILYYRRGKKNSVDPINKANPLQSSFGLSSARRDESEPKFYDFSKQSICFLGGFSVTDKNGENITGLFTPMLKYLLIILILSTQKDKKGISSQKLIQLLWYDKNEKSAQNNRNVYLSKLRSILENIGATDIINVNGFWSIQLHEDIICDYIEAMTLFNEIESNNNSTENINVDRLLELLLRGVLLPNTEADWIDEYKSNFSDLTIDILTEISRNKENNLPDEILLKIADTLFLHDYINEEALYIRCSIFFNSGKKGIAKTIYDNFCKEYHNSLGINYKKTLAQLLEK